jgi:hypothetical protein
MWMVACDDDDNGIIVNNPLEIVKSTVDFKASGGEGGISVAGNRLTLEAVSDADWCSITNVNGNQIAFSVSPNEEVVSRAATIQISGGGATKRVAVTQIGNLSPEPDAKDVEFDAFGGSRAINVSHSLPFTVSIETGVTWLTATVDGDVLTLTAARNETSNKLTATVTLTSGNLKTEIDVTQTGIFLIPETTSVKIRNDDTDVYVISVSSFLPFTAVSNEDWLTVVADANSVTLTATDNGTEPSRTAIVTLTSGELTATITVTQALPAYADFLGKWTLTANNNGTPFSYNLSIVQDVEGTSYKITGWGGSGVATDSKYAITANFDESSGLIYITAQPNLGTYTEEEDSYTVAYYGNIVIGGSVYYVSGSGYICYIGQLQRDGSVAWKNGSVTLTGGSSYDVVGANYFLIDADGGAISFKADSPFMRQPVMTKVPANARAAKVMTRGSGSTLKTRADGVMMAK